ncbi:MAG: hypothetical protein AVDCRST_MAG25-1616, partial [uncultured Rubrobacteraceae bacterium]
AGRGEAAPRQRAQTPGPREYHRGLGCGTARRHRGIPTTL